MCNIELKVQQHSEIILYAGAVTAEMISISNLVRLWFAFQATVLRHSVECTVGLRVQRPTYGLCECPIAEYLHSTRVRIG